MISPQKSWWLGLGLICVFWAWVELHDYPAPFVDDGYLIGAAINLAQNGIFSNPYCESLVTVGSASHFFAYMPLHSYVLAWWLKVAGVSTLSFHLFYTALALLASLLTFRFFPMRPIAWLYALLICFTVYGLLGGVGLRPDALGLVFFLIGVDAYRAKNATTFFFKNLFLGLTVITFPNLAVVSLLVSVSALVYQRVILNRPTVEWMRWGLALVAAYGFCFLIFLLCIDGLLFEFLQTLARAQSMGARGVHDRFQLFTALGITKWIVVQASFLVLAGFIALRWKSDPRRRAQFFLLVVTLLAFFIMGLSSFNSATGAHLWAFGCLVASLGIIATESLNSGVLALWGVVLVLAAFGHAHVAIEALLADPPRGPKEREALLEKIAQLHPQRLNVDIYAMRELYDYRLPGNAYYFEWCATDGWAQPATPNALPPHSLSVVSVKNAFPTPLSPDAGKAARPLRIGGHPLNRAYQNTYDLDLMEN